MSGIQEFRCPNGALLESANNSGGCYNGQDFRVLQCLGPLDKFVDGNVPGIAVTQLAQPIQFPKLKRRQAVHNPVGHTGSDRLGQTSADQRAAYPAFRGSAGCQSGDQRDTGPEAQGTRRGQTAGHFFFDFASSIASRITRRASSALPQLPTRTHFSGSRSL